MKPLGLVSQIVSIALAIAIGFLVVRPTFGEIGEIQNEIQQYQDERKRVTETNSTLAARVAALEAITPSDRQRIADYMPAYFDEVAILRDIEIMSQNAGVVYSIIQYNGEKIDQSESARNAASQSTVKQHEFAINVEGTYVRIKDFFSLLEQNHYPLQVHNLEMTALEGGFLGADVTLVTYVNDQSDLLLEE